MLSKVYSHEQDQHHRKTTLLLFKKRTSLSALNHILFPQVSITSHNETVPVRNNGVAFCLDGAGTILLNELSNRSKQTLFLSPLPCNVAISRVSIRTCRRVSGDPASRWASPCPSRRARLAGEPQQRLCGAGDAAPLADGRAAPARQDALQPGAWALPSCVVTREGPTLPAVRARAKA